MRRWFVATLLLLLLAACAPPPGDTSQPTAALIPSTETPTPTPVPPSATPQSLLSPQDVQASQQPVRTVTAAAGEVTDPVAQALVNVARRELAERMNVASRRIQLVSVEPVVWPDTSLGCPQPDITYAAAQIDGYRIVLALGGEQTLYHTDFDRVFPCAEADEQLPSTPEITPDVTAEATAD